MGPNAAAISDKYYFDPRKDAGLNLQLKTGSRKNREMIPQKQVREYLDVFSG